MDDFTGIRTLSVTHTAGVGPTTNVVLTDSLPVGTSFVSASAPYTQTGDTIQWGFASLDSQAAVEVDLLVSVDITATGAITNTDYSVISDQVAVVYGAPVTTPLEKLHFLGLEKTASEAMVFPGDLVTYTLSISNTHALITTTNVVLEDAIPAGSTFVWASGSFTRIGDTIRWSFPSLAPLGTASGELVVMADGNLAGQLVNEFYSVESDQAAMENGLPLSLPVGTVSFLPLVVRGP